MGLMADKLTMKAEQPLEWVIYRPQDKPKPKPRKSKGARSAKEKNRG